MTSKVMLFFLAGLTMPGAAQAWSWNQDKFSLDVSGYGTAGMIEPQDKKPDFLGDWRVRGQMAYGTRGDKMGLVYALDAQTIDDDDYIDDLFAFWQSRSFGRIELGMTDSVAGKLGLGLPDVGGMRANNNPLFYKKIRPSAPVIADTMIDSGDQVLRLNMVSNPIGGAQYGLSVATFADGYDYGLDAGVKVRQPHGKTKLAFSAGASFMDNLHNFSPDPYSPNVTADWRAQFGAGANLQYNSWVIALTARAIYDYDAITPASDGIATGIGASYDILNYSISLSYMLSSVGIWHNEDHQYTDNTVIGSFRYKYSANVDGWTSLGVSSKTPFVAAGLRLTF